MAPPEPSGGDGLGTARRRRARFVDPTMLTFANGARVVLNPTDDRRQRHLLLGHQPRRAVAGRRRRCARGAQRCLGRDLRAASASSTRSQLDTLLADAAIELYPSIGQTSEDFIGSSTTDDLELLLQLVNLYMLQTALRSGCPRLDRQQSCSPTSTIRTATPTLPSTSPTPTPDTATSRASRCSRRPTSWPGSIWPRSRRVWRERFANPATGCSPSPATSTSTTPPTWPGATSARSPAPASTEQFKDFQQDPPADHRHQGRARRHRRQGLVDVRLERADRRTRRPTASYADVLTSVLNIRLTDHIREELGASYSPSALRRHRTPSRTNSSRHT